MVTTAAKAGTNGVAPKPVRPPVTRQSPFVYANSRIPSPTGLAELVKEVEKDYQFLLGVRVINALAQTIRVAVTWQGGNDDVRAKRLADNLTETWYAMLPHALRCFAYGRSAFERTYRIEHGMALVDDLTYLPFEDSKLIIGDDGTFEGVEVQPEGEDKPLTLDPSESWWVALDPTIKMPHGQSRYTGAVLEVWKARRALDKHEEVWHNKFSYGHGVGKAPAEYPATPSAKGSKGEIGNDGNIRDPMMDLSDGIAALDSGGVLVLDSASYPNGGGGMFAYEPPTTRQDAGPLEARRQRLDDAALRSMGVTERSATQNADVGTNAMAATHLDVTFATVEEVFGQVAGAYQVVMEDARNWNWPVGQGPVFEFDWQSLSGSERGERIKSIVASLLSAPTVSPLFLHGVIDFEQLLTLAELPVGPNVAQGLADIREAAAVPPALPGLGGPAQFQLAVERPTIPPVAPTDLSIAEKAARADEPLLRELMAALGDGPESVDMVRL